MFCLPLRMLQPKESGYFLLKECKNREVKEVYCAKDRATYFSPFDLMTTEATTEIVEANKKFLEANNFLFGSNKSPEQANKILKSNKKSAVFDKKNDSDLQFFSHNICTCKTQLEKDSRNPNPNAAHEGTSCPSRLSMTLSYQHLPPVRYIETFFPVSK